MSTMTIGAGESLTYSTQEGSRYTSSVDCIVEFRKGASCNKLRFSCEDFSLGKGDKMFVTKGEKILRLALIMMLDNFKNFKIIIHFRFRKQRYRTQVYKGGLNVRFKSNKKGEASGAQCIMECVN